jgi:CheY-like chemotaxis protein
VRVNRGQLEQVIINLALNARDAMPDGGTLTITVDEIELQAGTYDQSGVIPAGRFARVVVRDSGVGMDSATAEQAFEPFFTTKPVGKGTGLGLAAAAGIMKQNSGYIALSSEPGKGAVFTLYLPALPSEEAVERRGLQRVPDGGIAAQVRATVLVVEDEAAVRAVVAESLERGGFQVLAAFDGADALAVIDQHGPPDLVLSDLMMPGISGLELARRLKIRWPQLPIIFMSGYSVDDLRRQSAADFDGILIQKPFTPEALVGQVVGALQSRQPAGGGGMPG